jgi:hypothetical protein
MQFLISMHINPAVLDALTDEEKTALGGGHGAFIAALKESGELITTQALVDRHRPPWCRCAMASRW